MYIYCWAIHQSSSAPVRCHHRSPLSQSPTKCPGFKRAHPLKPSPSARSCIVTSITSTSVYHYPSLRRHLRVGHLLRTPQNLEPSDTLFVSSTRMPSGTASKDRRCGFRVWCEARVFPYKREVPPIVQMNVGAIPAAVIAVLVHIRARRSIFQAGSSECMPQGSSELLARAPMRCSESTLRSLHLHLRKLPLGATRPRRAAPLRILRQLSGSWLLPPRRRVFPLKRRNVRSEVLFA